MGKRLINKRSYPFALICVFILIIFGMLLAKVGDYFQKEDEMITKEVAFVHSVLNCKTEILELIKDLKKIKDISVTYEIQPNKLMDKISTLEDLEEKLQDKLLNDRIKEALAILKTIQSECEGIRDSIKVLQLVTTTKVMTPDEPKKVSDPFDDAVFLTTRVSSGVDLVHTKYEEYLSSLKINFPDGNRKFSEEPRASILLKTQQK